MFVCALPLMCSTPPSCVCWATWPMEWMLFYHAFSSSRHGPRWRSPRSCSSRSRGSWQSSSQRCTTSLVAPFGFFRWTSVSCGRARRIVSCTRVPWTAAVWTLNWSEDLVTILRYYPRCKFIHFCRGLAEVGVGSLVSPSICRFSAEWRTSVCCEETSWLCATKCASGR